MNARETATILAALRCYQNEIDGARDSTLQLGRLFVGKHFRGVRCWSLDVWTSNGCACFGLFHIMPLGRRLEKTTARAVLRGKLDTIILHAGPFLVTLAFNAGAQQEKVDALLRAEVLQ